MKSMNNEPPPAIPVSVPLLDGRKNVNASLTECCKSSLTEKMNRFLDLTDLKTGRLNFFIRKR